MKITAIQTPVFYPPQTDIYQAFDNCELNLIEGSVVAISAKIVAIHEGLCVKMKDDLSELDIQKDELITQEAEWYLDRDMTVLYPRVFTIYEGTLCSSCGIDASNGNGYWILLPRNSSNFAEEMRTYLCTRYGIEKLGVIIVDSRSYPMRNGTIGMTIGYAGFEPEFDYRERKDLFGRPFFAERINVADCMASTATLAMGEGDESTPVVVMQDIQNIVFSDTPSSKDPFLSLKVSMEEDVFTQFYRDKGWKKGGRNIS